MDGVFHANSFSSTFNLLHGVILQHDRSFSKGEGWFLHAYGADLTDKTSCERTILRRQELLLFWLRLVS